MILLKIMIIYVLTVMIVLITMSTISWKGIIIIIDDDHYGEHVNDGSWLGMIRM